MVYTIKFTNQTRTLFVAEQGWLLCGYNQYICLNECVSIETLKSIGILYEYTPHLFRSSGCLKQEPNEMWCTACMKSHEVDTAYTKLKRSKHPFVSYNCRNRKVTLYALRYLHDCVLNQLPKTQRDFLFQNIDAGYIDDNAEDLPYFLSMGNGDYAIGNLAHLFQHISNGGALGVIKTFFADIKHTTIVKHIAVGD